MPPTTLSDWLSPRKHICLHLVGPIAGGISIFQSRNTGSLYQSRPSGGADQDGAAHMAEDETSNERRRVQMKEGK